ncbi:uncharacterized protein LOC131153877 [Malania oleifera]|uniref:uncharacterized protein LOC131153877 n=1 Tax=Malania oleifera TaxID=397392 RepID=UPI0025AE056E|nr:uncharacterized protein LOC131153877 [Malania oleifera]
MSFGIEKIKVIDEEVTKLVQAKFVREVNYPEWLSNVVLVGKSNGKWHTYIDFTDLNKACSKDNFPLPRIDQLVDSTSRHEFLSFMDAYSGYNQILMHRANEEKTSFITERGLYCYRVMPFGLKNAGATYQRLVNRIFKDQFGKMMDEYVDDMLVKSLKVEEHYKDLREMFELLRRSSNAVEGGAGIILTTPDDTRTQYALKFEFSATNNYAEYEALLVGLRRAEALEVTQIKVSSDSQLVVEQVKGEFEARDQKMNKYLAKVQEYAKVFTHFDIEHVPRAENTKADALTKLASTTGSEWRDAIYLEQIVKPSYEEGSVNLLDSEINEGDWRTPLVQYLCDGSLLEDKKESLKVRRKAARYALINKELYRRSLTLPYLRCLSNEKAEYILREIHEGVCGNHLASRALAQEALQQGFYWSTMRKDAVEFVKRCDRSQRCAGVPHVSSNLLSPLTTPCPFTQWGLDIIGPLPPVTGQRKFMLVAIDYFTMWIEIEALAHITERNITRFIWTSVVCRFGIPWAIVTDHGRQFDNEHFKKLCSDLSIKLLFASMAHPQSNGHMENINRTILYNLWKRLESM